MARSITFIIEGDIDTQVTITENDDGTLLFDLSVLGSGQIGDLRALFFDLEGFDSGQGGLSATSTAAHEDDITNEDYGEASIDTLGQDANVKGAVSNELGDFDVGIEFGTSGMATDDIQQTSFVLAWTGGDRLSLDMLSLADFGLRYTSVGDADGSRTGSAKIGDRSNGVAVNDALEVDENASVSANLLDNDTGTLAVIGASWDLATGFSDSGAGLTADLVVEGRALGTVTILSDGSITVAADGVDVDDLAEGETVEVGLTYTAEAPDGSLASADATITIHGQADVTAIAAEPIDLISLGAPGGSRMVAVGSDGALSESGFLTNNGGYAYGTALGDIDGDGHLDLLMSGDWSGAFIYLGDGSGTFSDSGVRISGQFQDRVAIADIDNDGDGDIYLQNGRGAAEVWRNDGGIFAKVFSYTDVSSSGVGRTPGEAVFEDVNGDGAVDLLISRRDGFDVSIADKLFINDGTGNFTDSGTLLPTAAGYSPGLLADIDNDGDADYVRGTSSGIAVALNDGAGNFTSPASDLGASYNGTVALADFDGDGVLDAMRGTPDTDEGIQLWLGNGVDGFVFEETVALATQGVVAAIHAGDFSGDGIADLVFNRTGGEIVTMVNDGTGHFTEADVLALSGYLFGADVGLM